MTFRLFLNFGAFQLCWFGSVLSASYGVPLWALVLAISVVALHLAFTSDWRRELKGMLLVSLLGCGCEVLLGLGGWIAIEGHAPPDWTYAAWFFSFWLNFSTVLNVSLRWLHRRPGLAILLGAVGGPPAYYGAQQLGALQLLEPQWQTLLLLAIYWGVAFPAALGLAQRINPARVEQRPTDSPVEGSTP